MKAQTVPFSSPDDAWFWTAAALAARRNGVSFSPGHGGVARPCTPDDVLLALDRLYRQRKIDLAHVRVLRVWGERGFAPAADVKPESLDAKIWGEAMARLYWPLRSKGFIA